MPIYEYRCGGCGHEFEEWQKINDEPVKKCPSCRGRRVERLVSATSFQLKGGGWYISDYGRGSGGPATRPDARGGNAESADASTEAKATAGKGAASAGSTERSTEGPIKAAAKRSSAKESAGSKASGSAGTAAS